MFSVPVSELALLASAIAIGGVVTGILAGLFGIGGGAIIVPVLYEVFRVLGVPAEVHMQLCIGTSLAIIVPTTLRSYFAHRVKGAVMMDVLRRWAAPAVVGVVAGAGIAAVAPGGVFKAAFALIAYVIAARLLVGGDSWRLADDLPGPLTMSGWGLVIGLCSSMMGVSGGSISNMILTLYKRPIHQAVATSAGLGVPITLAGTLGFMLAGLPHQALMPPLSIGYVSLIGLALMAPISSYTAAYGVRLAHAMSHRTLEIALGAFLLVMGSRFLLSLVW